MPPWEKYQSTAASSGPWSKYQSASSVPPPEKTPPMFGRGQLPIPGSKQGLVSEKDVQNVADVAMLAPAGAVDVAVTRGLTKLAPKVAENLAGKMGIGATGGAAGGAAYNVGTGRDPVTGAAIGAGIGAAAPIVGKAVGAIAEKGKELSSARHEKFINDLVSAPETPKVKKAQVYRTKEVGMNQKKVVEPTADEKAMAKEVAKLPVSRRNSLQKNFNIIQEENLKEAKSIQEKLAKNDVKIDYGDVQKALNNTVDELGKNIYLGSQGKIAGKRAAAKMTEIILKNAGKNGEITASGLLKARKEFDRAVGIEKPRAFNPDAPMTAGTEAVYKMRRALNDLLEQKMPNAAYKASMRKQNLLYDAMKNIAPKATKEPKSLAGRVMVHPVTKTIGYGAGAVGAAELGKHYLTGGQ